MQLEIKNVIFDLFIINSMKIIFVTFLQSDCPDRVGTYAPMFSKKKSINAEN
jgi:hypothetical protein